MSPAIGSSPRIRSTARHSRSGTGDSSSAALIFLNRTDNLSGSVFAAVSRSKFSPRAIPASASPLSNPLKAVSSKRVILPESKPIAWARVNASIAAAAAVGFSNGLGSGCLWPFAIFRTLSGKRRLVNHPSRGFTTSRKTGLGAVCHPVLEWPRMSARPSQEGPGPPPKRLRAHRPTITTRGSGRSPSSPDKTLVLAIWKHLVHNVHSYG